MLYNAPRRTVLDSMLVDSAVEAGASFAFGWALHGLVWGRDRRVIGARIVRGDQERVVTADWVVGADGVRSRVARMVEADVVHESMRATATMYAHWPGLPNDGYHWHFGPGTGVGIIPTDGGNSCVFAAVTPARFRLVRGRVERHRLFVDTIRSCDPALADHVQQTAPPTALRGFAGVPGFLRKAHGDGWALVGDAGFFKDPLTAHGITDALRDAELLARGIVEGPTGMTRYEATRDDVAQGLIEVTDRIASLRWDAREVQLLHKRLARAMGRGVDVIRGLGCADCGLPSERFDHLCDRCPRRTPHPDERGRSEARPTAVPNQPQPVGV